LPIATRLYYDSPALTFTARVADIRLVTAATSEAPALWQVALDRTAFYPTGGGQPHDTGTLIATSKSGATLEVNVERVEEDETGEVWHYIRKPLNEGTEITGHIDAPRRIDHAQQHTGQHLLSAVFLRELAARTVSFHLSADNVTIDLVSIDEATPLKLTEADLRLAEAAANLLIFDNRTITPTCVDRAEAEAMLARGDLRKLPDREGPMRLVEIEGVEFNACGGTHVASTGAIGSILVRRVTKAKQAQRVEFLCGLRAVAAAHADYLLLDTIARTLTVGATDVPSRVEKLMEEKKQLSRELKKLTSDMPKPTPPPQT
jgi:alanyl-tRNA synthetase